MIKKLKSSLTAKIFIITALLLTICCIATYSFIVWMVPKTYPNQVDLAQAELLALHMKNKLLSTIISTALFASLVENKDEILEGYEIVLQTLTDTTALEKKRAELQGEYEIVMELMRKGVEENARATLDQEEYNQRYEALMERYEVARCGIADTDSKLADRNAKREKISRFLDDLKQHEGLLEEFDEKLWLATVDFVCVHSESKMTVRFKDGMEATVDAETK